MKTKFIFSILSLSILIYLGMIFSFQNKTSAPTLKKNAVIDLPGEKGKRFDYLTIDYKHNYLLSAHLGANVLYVIDTKTNKLVKMIADTPGAEGVELVPELNKVYTSNWKDHTIGVIDMNKMEVIKKSLLWKSRMEMRMHLISKNCMFQMNEEKRLL